MKLRAAIGTLKNLAGGEVCIDLGSATGTLLGYVVVGGAGVRGGVPRERA